MPGNIRRGFLATCLAGSVFYAAIGTYSAAYTCNTWTAEGLYVSGIPVTAAGVVFSGQLIDQVQALSDARR